MKTDKIRQAYLTLLQAVKEKPIDKTKKPRQRIIQIHDSACYIRSLQDVACYLDAIQ